MLTNDKRTWLEEAVRSIVTVGCVSGAVVLFWAACCSGVFFVYSALRVEPKDRPAVNVAQKQSGVFRTTAKAKGDLNKVPLKAHTLIVKMPDGGDLIQAGYMGDHPIGFSGAGFRPTTSSDWSGFYVGKAVSSTMGPRDESIKLRSFILRAVTTYAGFYDLSSAEATPAETRILKSRGHLE